jgi:hypothetical protein
VGTLAEEVRDAWLAEMEGIYDTDTNLSIVRVESQSFSTELTVGEPGTGSINSMTPQVCALLSKSSIGKGPRFRGRNYFAQVLDEGHVDEDGIISGTRLDTLNAANAAFTSAITGGAVATSLAIPQSDVEGQKSEPVLPWPEVQSQAFQPLTATQRRRIR